MRFVWNKERGTIFSALGRWTLSLILNHFQHWVDELCHWYWTIFSTGKMNSVIDTEPFSALGRWTLNGVKIGALSLLGKWICVKLRKGHFHHWKDVPCVKSRKEHCYHWQGESCVELRSKPCQYWEDELCVKIRKGTIAMGWWALGGVKIGALSSLGRWTLKFMWS